MKKFKDNRVLLPKINHVTRKIPTPTLLNLKKVKKHLDTQWLLEGYSWLLVRIHFNPIDRGLNLSVQALGSI